MTRNDNQNSIIRRIGRAVARVHQARRQIPDEIKPRIGTLLAAGDAMDFISRIHGYTSPLSPTLSPAALALYAEESGIAQFQLLGSHLPALKAANVVDFTVKDGQLESVNEYVGITGSLVEQTARVLDAFGPTPQELALLHSVEVGAFAPLTEQQHLEELRKRGFSDQQADEGYKLSRAARVNKRIHSTGLNDNVVYNPYVWQRGELQVAEFLRNLPPNERDMLLGLTEQAAQKQGLAVGELQMPNPGVFNAARRVGLLQSATVKSAGGGGKQQTYVFSPTNDHEDDALETTESLHLRKLFVAHILFGNELAAAQGGQIRDPVVLVRALLNHGSVGPATNIGTDYMLLESSGIVQVEHADRGRAYLRLVNREIVEGGLAWLNTATRSVGRVAEVKLLRSPSGFANPEDDARMGSDDGAADEVVRSAILRLREELQSGARQDTPFEHR